MRPLTPLTYALLGHRILAYTMATQFVISDKLVTNTNWQYSAIKHLPDGRIVGHSGSRMHIHWILFPHGDYIIELEYTNGKRRGASSLIDGMPLLMSEPRLIWWARWHPDGKKVPADRPDGPSVVYAYLFWPVRRLYF